MTIQVARELAGSDAPVDEVIELEFATREKSRFRAPMLSGEEIGVDLPPGTILRHGDRLRLPDGRTVAVEAARERLVEVHAHDAVGLARIAYHVGNRHVPLQIGPGRLRLLPDHVLQAMIERLGGHVHEVEEAFQPESGAYGHSHVHHAHDDQGHGGRIHAFDPRHEQLHDPDHEHRHLDHEVRQHDHEHRHHEHEQRVHEHEQRGHEHEERRHEHGPGRGRDHPGGGTR